MANKLNNPFKLWEAWLGVVVYPVVALGTEALFGVGSISAKVVAFPVTFVRDGLLPLLKVVFGTFSELDTIYFSLSLALIVGVLIGWLIAYLRRRK